MSNCNNSQAIAPSGSSNSFQFTYSTMDTKPTLNRPPFATLLSPPEAYQHLSFGKSPMSVSLSVDGSHAVSSTSSSSSSSSSFSTGASIVDMNKRLLPMPLSPVSPALSKEETQCSDHSNAENDPALFPITEPGVQGPLFPDQLEAQSEAIIARHISRTSASRGPKPTREEYQFVSCVIESIKAKGANNYLDEEMATWGRYKTIGKKASRKDDVTRRVLAPRVTGVRKTVKQSLPKMPRIQRVRRTPKEALIEDFEALTPPATVSPTPKAPRPATTRDDSDFASLPDCSPPIDTLPPNSHPSKVLKADWKGQQLDLSTDPHRHLLHEAELHLAATLRLSCATYLSSKRRLFAARVDCLRRGKEFRKTDAQQACKIDVNKASKLHTAFEKVGWFQPHYFTQYL